MVKRDFIESLIGWLMVAALIVVVVSIAILLIGVFTAHADNPRPVFGPPQTVLWIADLNAPAIEVPIAFAVQAVSIVQCESRFDSHAVGAAGERGQFQIHPIHRQAMAERGLDFEKEGDRVRWAVTMWERRGWRDWGCYDK